MSSGANFKPHARMNIVKEIHETEESYIQGLDAVENAYAKPLRETIGTKGSLIEQKDYDLVFSDLSVIRGLGKKLLKQIETRLDEDKKKMKPTLTIGEIFKKFAPFLKTYTTYCNNFDRISAKLRDLRKANKNLNEFFDNQRKFKKELSLGYDINSLLITPVQRIPRYNLLLKDLLSKTSQNHRDYPYLVEGLKEIQSVANYVNEKMREFEHHEKLNEISSAVTVKGDFAVVKPARKHAFSQEVLIYENNEWKEKWLYFFNDGLLICDSKNRMENFYDFMQSPYPWIVNIKEEENENFKNAIQIVHQDETIIVSIEKKKEDFINGFIKVMDDIVKEMKIKNVERATIKYQKEKKMKQIKHRKSIFSSFSTKKDASSSSESLSELDNYDDITIKRNEGIIKEDELAKEKDNILGLGFILEDLMKLNSDELKLNLGDLVEIKTNPKKISGNDYYICSKIGMNIFPPSEFKKEYSEYCDLLYEEKKKKLYPHYFSLDKQPKLFLNQEDKKCNLEDKDEFLKGIQNYYHEYNLIGLVQKKYVQLFSHQFNLDLLDFIQKRDDEEESKIRNFKINKKGKTKKDKYIESYQSGLTVTFKSNSLKVTKNERKRKLSAPVQLTVDSDSSSNERSKSLLGSSSSSSNESLLLYPNTLPKHLQTQKEGNSPDTAKNRKSLFALKKK